MTRMQSRCTRAAVLGFAAGAAVLAGCSTNRTTGRSQFLTMSRDDEIKVGTEAKPELTTEFGGEVPSAELRAYINDLGQRLAAQTAVDDPTMATLPWEFTFLNSDVINAFALPGGKVFVSRGLAKEMTNEAQMAAVIGHEIGHVTARHSNERVGQQIGTTLLGAAAGAAIGAAVSSNDRAAGAGIGAGAGAAAGGIWALAYSRDQEIEADRLGMRYMERLKYDPTGAIEVQQILQREAAKGGGRGPEILATHPSSETRIDALRARMQKYYQHTAGNPAYTKGTDRFKAQFLDKLATIPPPPPAKKAQLDGARWTRSMMASAAGLALDDPGAWCWVCAANSGRLAQADLSAADGLQVP